MTNAEWANASTQELVSMVARDTPDGLRALEELAERADAMDAAATELTEARETSARLEALCPGDAHAPCRCGSGAHPRQCTRHPAAYDHHVRQMNHEAALEERAEKAEAEVKRLAKALDDALGAPCEQIRHGQEVEALRGEVGRLKKRLAEALAPNSCGG